MLTIVLALLILSLPFVLARVTSANSRNADRRGLSPVRVRVDQPQIERRRSR